MPDDPDEWLREGGWTITLHSFARPLPWCAWIERISDKSQKHVGWGKTTPDAIREAVRATTDA